jgi:hypothetical protein
MSRKIEVYDPPMCCSSGVCGPKVDKRLVRFQADLEWLRAQGVGVERFNPAQQYDAFARNALVVRTVNERGMECLPLILADGEIASQGTYPQRAELAAMAGLAAAPDKGA